MHFYLFFNELNKKMILFFLAVLTNLQPFFLWRLKRVFTFTIVI